MVEIRKDLYPEGCRLKEPLLARLAGAKCLSGCMGAVDLEVHHPHDDGWSIDTTPTGERIRFCPAGDMTDQLKPGEFLVDDTRSKIDIPVVVRVTEEA